MTTPPLRYGFFKEFADPTFMFFGGRASLAALHDILLALPSRQRIQIEEDPRFRPVANERLCLRLTAVAEGMRYEPSSREFFEWRLSSDQALHFAEQVKGVIDTVQPCHDYLDTMALDDVVVVVSKDEYPESWQPGS